MPGETLRAFKDWFWRPPRPHGATIRDRVVTNLELFYDLVYVAVIGQAAHHLAGQVEARTVAEFAVVFALIWFAWINGSLYLDLHGQPDGRTRLFVFLQMGILALLAVFTGGAAGESGAAFAVVYAIDFAVMGWLWHAVRGQDEAEYRTLTGVYVVGMVLSVAVMLASAFLPAGARLLVWAGFSLAWVLAFVVFGRLRAFEVALEPTHSMVERFGLFTIIVLGEVVIGVVGGLSDARHDPLTIATGMLGLCVGFGFWWTYFDIIGRRLPRPAGTAIVTWLLGHLPITMAIAAAGAGMASLITHAHDPTTPAATARLLAGAVALGLIALIATARSLEAARHLPGVYGKIARTMAAGAAAALLAGWLRPAPWLLAALLGAILLVVWFVAVSRFLRAQAWAEVPSHEAGPSA
jgi:low temperature requirement protein LtrA